MLRTVLRIGLMLLPQMAGFLVRRPDAMLGRKLPLGLKNRGHCVPNRCGCQCATAFISRRDFLFTKR
jgi:hypothetical protein